MSIVNWAYIISSQAFEVNELLARYFSERKQLTSVGFSKLKESNLDELFIAWPALPVKQGKAMESEFHRIHDMSCKKHSWHT